MVGGSNPLRPEFIVNLCILLIFLILLLKVSFAQETTIILYTPQIISNPERIEINQTIEIYSQQYWIKSNRALIDKKQRKIIIPEKTFIKNTQTGDEFLTENIEIRYDQNGNISEITGGKGSGYLLNFGQEPLKFKDKLFFNYSKLNLFSSNYIFYNVKFSTCNICEYECFDEKHYLLISEKVEVIPKDKMILTNSRLNLYKKNVFGYKKLIIPLKKKKLPQLHGEDTSAFPKIGYNNTDGFFVTKNFDYYFSNTNYGRILTKYGQYTGLYYGISNYYQKQIGKLNLRLNNYFFFNNNKRYGNSFRNVQSDLNFNMSNFSAFFRYSSNRSIYRNFVSPLNENISYGFNTSVKGISINYSANKTSTEKYFSSLNQFLNISGNYRNLNFRFTVNDLENEYFSTNVKQKSQNFKFDMDYLFSNGFYTLTFLVDNTNNNYGFFGVNKLPELMLKMNKPIKVRDSITITPSFFLGKYEEPSFNRRTTKYQFLMNYTIDHIKSKDITMRTTGFFKQNFFDTGNYYFDRNFHASYVNSFTTNFNMNKKWFRLNINYSYNFGKGFAPIFADFTGKYQNLSGNLSIFNNKSFDLSLSTNYNLNLGSISPISINLKYYPNNNFYASIFTTFDTKRSLLTNINTNIDWYIAKDLRLTAWFNYNSFTKKIDYIDFVLVKDNHCWVTYLVYRSSIKQLYLYAYLKALPILGINIGIDQSSKFIPQYR